MIFWVKMWEFGSEKNILNINFSNNWTLFLCCMVDFWLEVAHFWGSVFWNSSEIQRSSKVPGAWKLMLQHYSLLILLYFQKTDLKNKLFVAKNQPSNIKAKFNYLKNWYSKALRYADFGPQAISVAQKTVYLMAIWKNS